MYRIKGGCMVLLALLLTGCAGASGQSADEAKDMLMLEVLETEEEQDSRTSTFVLEKTDISAVSGSDATLIFPYGSVISYDNPYAQITFEEYLVEKGSFVTEGQALIRLSQQVGEAEELEASLAYERISDYYELVCEDYEQQLAQLTPGEVRYEQLAYEYACFQEDTQEELEKLSVQLEAYEAVKSQPEVILTAPFDGYVSDRADIVSGKSIDSGSGILMLQDTDIWYYQLREPGEDATIPLGAAAALTVEDDNGRVTELSGTVVRSDMVLDNMKEGAAWVRFDRIEVDGVETDGIDVTALPGTASVKITMTFLENVLAVPSEYVHVEENQYYYVKRLKDGVIQKVYFTAPMGNVGGKYWVLSGLSEGDVLTND